MASKLRPCTECGDIKPVAGRGLCWRCYGRARRQDPEYRERNNQRTAAREKELRATDPEYRERRNARLRSQYLARRDADPHLRAAVAARRESLREATREAAGPRSWKHYTADEDALIMRCDLTLAEIAFLLSRPLPGVQYRRARLSKEKKA